MRGRVPEGRNKRSISLYTKSGRNLGLKGKGGVQKWMEKSASKEKKEVGRGTPVFEK